MRYARWTWLSSLVLLLAASSVRADLIEIPDHPGPQTRFDLLRQRLTAHPNAVDRADAYCDDRATGAACDVPGAPFDGGGAGVCVRRANLADDRIDKVCAPRVALVIDHNLPDGPWQPEDSFCSRRPYGADAMAMLAWQCEAPEEVRDRFCARADVGSHCIAEGSLDGLPARVEGICTRHIQTKAEESIGVMLSRPVVTCESAHPAPHALTTYGAWRKLFQ